MITVGSSVVGMVVIMGGVGHLVVGVIVRALRLPDLVGEAG